MAVFLVCFPFSHLSPSFLFYVQYADRTLLGRTLYMCLASVWYGRLSYLYLHFTDAACSGHLRVIILRPIFSIFQTPRCGTTSSDAETAHMQVCLDCPFGSFVEIRSPANIKVI
jgi:hypothetical protein